MILLLVLLACEQGPAGQALDDVAHGRCEDLPFPEAAVPCWTEAAAAAARAGDATAAAVACDAIAPALWRDECHFRVGEALGLGGNLPEAAAACAGAGRFAEFCLMHLAWWARPFPIALRPDQPGAADAVADQLQALAPIAVHLAPHELSMLRASVWFDLYLGSGVAAPGPAQVSDQPEARTAWAHEAIRLAPRASAEELLAAWQGLRPPPSGPSLEPRCWGGRLDESEPIPAMVAVPRTALVHGGQRLVGRSPEEDLAIAILEARAFHGVEDLEELRAAALDPRSRVQWTAARLLARAAGASDPTVAALRRGDDAAMVGVVEGGLRARAVDWVASEECP